MKRRVSIIFALAAAVATAACGSKKDGDVNVAIANGSDAAKTSDVDIDAAGGSGEITAIDAATADARGMPAEYNGPTAYDMAEKNPKKPKAMRDKEEEAPNPAIPNNGSKEIASVD